MTLEGLDRIRHMRDAAATAVAFAAGKARSDLETDLRFYPLNFYATCGEVVHQHVHYLFGCGYAALGTGPK